MHLAHPLIDPTDSDTYFQWHDLAAGQRLVARDRHPVVRREEGRVLVLLCDSEPAPGADPWAVAAEWGAGETEEEAWRYALGAACGPVDAEYDESRLIGLLQVV